MKAMILAAGRGERMRPLTDSKPKPLLEVKGKPLIQWHIERLRSAGIRNIVVNASWLKEQLIDFLGDGSRFGVNVMVSIEPDGALETAGGIVQALDLLGERFIVVNGDVWTDHDPADLLALPDTGDLAHLVLVENPAHNGDGDFCLQNGRIVQSECGSAGKSTDKRHTFAGIGAYHRNLFAELEPGVRKLAPLLRETISAGRVSGELHAGQWSDIGTPERLAALN